MKKVSTKEVKRAFVVAQLVRQQKGKKRYLGVLSREEFKKLLTKSKKRALAMSVKQLDKIIATEYPKRLRAYDTSEWHIGSIPVKEVGVWRGAGGLPRAWTMGSLHDTATKVAHALKKNPKLLKQRAKRAIENILKTNVTDIQKEKYLLPIVFEGGTGTNGRKSMRRMKGDIDDGCMRSVALAVHGAKIIRVYFGIPTRER